MRQIPIYWINLASRPDRRAFMEEQFDRLELKAERIEAVTPEQIDAALLRKYTDPRKYRWMMPSELACAMSHIRALEAVAASGDWGCIFEDDAKLAPALPQFLADYAALPMDLDILRLEAVSSAMRIIPSDDIRLSGFSTARIRDSLPGSAGYLVAPKAARIAARHRSMMFLFADEALFSSFRPINRELEVRQLMPALCMQASMQSTIDTQRRQRSLREAAHPWHQMKRRFLRVVDMDFVVGSQKILGQVRGTQKRIVPVAPDGWGLVDHSPGELALSTAGDP